MIAITVILGSFVGWRFFYFFRNPRRTIFKNDQHILSPADGYVVYMKRVDPGEPIISIKANTPIRLDDLMVLEDAGLYQKPGYLVGIFMSAFDVHYNRAPIKGYIHQIGRYFPTSDKKNQTMFNSMDNLIFDHQPGWKDLDYLITNERCSYTFKNDRLTIYVTQIADRWINKIVTLRNNIELDQGDIFGLIRMGSQVDVFVPDPNARIVPLVIEKQRVQAGLSALFEIQRS